QYLASGQSVEHAYNWVVTVAKNLALDKAKRSRWEIVPSAQNLWRDRLRDKTPSVEDQLMQRERGDEFDRLLSTLSGIQRDCIYRRARGVPFREIGQRLGMSASAIIYQTNLAMKKLQCRTRF